MTKSKKFISLLISVILTVSCFTVIAAIPAHAAEGDSQTVNSDTAFTLKTDSNLFGTTTQTYYQSSADGIPETITVEYYVNLPDADKRLSSVQVTVTYDQEVLTVNPDKNGVYDAKEDDYDNSQMIPISNGDGLAGLKPGTAKLSAVSERGYKLIDDNGNLIPVLRIVFDVKNGAIGEASIHNQVAVMSLQNGNGSDGSTFILYNKNTVNQSVYDEIVGNTGSIYTSVNPEGNEPVIEQLIIDGKPANGVYNNRYYVDGYAQDVTGLVEANGTFYLFDSSFETDGPFSGIYFDNSGAELTGRYFENGKPANPGIVLFQGDFYCTTTGGWLVKGEKQIYSSRTSGLIPAGTYTFGDDFKMIDTEAKNGIINGVYYENGVAKNPGLVKVGNDFYCTTTGGKLVYGDKEIFSSRTNGLLPPATYHFDEVTGKLYKHNVIINNVYYYEGAPKNVGIVKVAGSYYVTTTGGVIVKNETEKYIASSRTNGLVAIGYYDFGADGKMILKNGIIGGKYYKDGKIANVGLFEYEADGVTSIYCTTTGGVIIKNENDKYIASSRTNGLASAGYHSFDADGKMIK